MLSVFSKNHQARYFYIFLALLFGILLWHMYNVPLLEYCFLLTMKHLLINPNLWLMFRFVLTPTLHIFTHKSSLYAIKACVFITCFRDLRGHYDKMIKQINYLFYFPLIFLDLNFFWAIRWNYCCTAYSAKSSFILKTKTNQSTVLSSVGYKWKCEDLVCMDICKNMLPSLVLFPLIFPSNWLATVELPQGGNEWL